MSVNIPTHYAQQFATNVQLLLQQRMSKLRGAVTSGAYVGEQASPVDQIGSVDAQVVNSRFEPMTRIDAPTDRRWVFPTNYHLPQLLDTFDKLRLLLDPTSAYVVNATAAMGRAIDTEIISGMRGTNKTGKAGGTSTTLPSAQKVDVAFGASANVGLTVAKLREAKKKLMAAEVDIDTDPLFCAMTAEQHDDLLGEIQVTSMDFNTKPVLVDGKLTSFMGFNFLHCERLTTVTTSVRAVMAWAKSGVHLGVWNDIQHSLSQRNDLSSEPFQVYTKGVFGATRLEEAKVVEIACAE